MEYALHVPQQRSHASRYPLWVFLHGAFSTAQQADLFIDAANTHNAILLAPQATRPCGAGFCWSFAHDTHAVQHLLARVQQHYSIDPIHSVLIGYSMGCTLGLWLLAKQPHAFAFFAALGMGSAFERWEHDDGGIDEDALRWHATQTRVLLAVDQADPGGNHAYFAENYQRLCHVGFTVATFRPHEGTHAITDAIRARVLQSLPR